MRWLLVSMLGVLAGVVVGLGALMLVAAAAGAASTADFELRVAGQTSSTVTFAWDRVPGASGFEFYADGRRVSSSRDGSRTSVRFSTGPARFEVRALPVGTGSGYWPAVTPPPPPPPPPAGTVVRNGQGWTCSGPVDLALVKVSNPPGDAITLASGCTGRIARIEVDTRTEDGVKIQNRANAARDVTIGGGYVRCTGFSPGAHQDAVQAMGGSRITFTGVTFDCLGNSNFFVNRAGSGASTPTDVVCVGCRFGAKSSTTVRVNVSVRSGARNSQGCVGRNIRQAFYFTSLAQQPVDSGNVTLPANDPLCAR